MKYNTQLWRYFSSLAAVSVLPMFIACGSLGPSELELTAESGNEPGSGAGSLGGFDPGGATGGGGFEKCAESSALAELVTVNMFIAVDKSGSMGSNDKWNNAKAAFSAFFQDPAADDLSVALRFWPDGGCNSSSCSADACSQAQVSLGSLADSAHEQQLVTAFDAQSPGGYTPMSAALEGATSWAIDNQASNGGTERTVVVLLTDGQPKGCDENIDNISGHAADAYAQSEILTFAVGLQGSFEADVNKIAQAGETQLGYFVGQDNAEAELLAALLEIQKNSVACSFKMPVSEDPSKTVDPEKVNVRYIEPNAEPVTIPKLPGEEYCSDQQPGWYYVYDESGTPTVIKLCESACDGINVAEGGEVKIVVGCQSIGPV